MHLFKRFYSISIILLLFSSINAQDDLTKKLPVDPKVRIGKLENGFTYYILVNRKPEKRVEMRLAVNAGSILEDEDQRGLAHFVEHMAFNGTTNFEKNELKNYLESIGMRFGPELNAYTSFDETVYMLTIPSDSAGLLDKGFLVMEDWAHGLTFEDNEIDKERGILVEEWRLGQGYGQRMRDKYLPVILKNSMYAERLPIGKREIIENAPYETVRSFYRDWYRPDLMALVVVGDIDADYAEMMIREHFSSLKMPEVVRERKKFDIPDHEGTLVSTVSDPEAPMSMSFIMYKADVDSQLTYGDYLHSLRYSFVTGMLNRRMAEITELENPPFIGGGFSYGPFISRAKNALQGYAYFSEKNLMEATKTILLEAKKVDSYGFTQSEFDRFKLDLVNNYERAYNEREKTESRELAAELVRNFLSGEPIPGIAFEYEFVKNNIDRIRPEEINEIARNLVREDNRVMVVATPEKAGFTVPTEDEILALAKEISDTIVDPYSDKVFASELMKNKPKSGKIVKEKEIREIEAIDLKLSNGVRVILKPTNFKNDEVLITAFSMGGHSVYPDADHFSALHADAIISESGVGQFPKSEITKILAGKTVYVVPSINYEMEQISANAKSSDIESALQLIYLYFTNPRIDKSSFNSYVSKQRAMFENLAKEPQNFFFDKYYRIRAQNHPRGDYLPLPEDWDKINFERAVEIYRDRFANASEFTFIIVGAFDVEKIKPFLKQYIASLPVKKRNENFVDLGMRPPAERSEKIFKGSDQKSLAVLYFEKETTWNERDAFMISALNDILLSKYIDILREEVSGVYAVRVNAYMEKIPYGKAAMQIMIPCSPDNVDSLINLAVNEFVKIRTQGVDENQIAKVKEQKRRQLEISLQSNRYWSSAIMNALMLKGNFENLTKENYISQITSEEIKRVANEYFNTEKYLRVVLYPENYKSE